ncbi:MAG: exonuclease SbcCD subunit D [Saccharospirillum sp.]|nr:exonuclease SbcCD subunit D [Saccharospirillum sp.]
MRLLHTSDWHLGRQFHNVSLLDDQRFVLQQLLDIVEQDAVDAVIVAGDVYDRAIPPAEAVTLLNETLYSLCVERKVPVVMISGNHDSAQRLGFGSGLMAGAGLHLISQLDQVAEPVMLRKGDESVAVFGVPYCTPELVRDFSGEDVRSFDAAHTWLVDQAAAARPQAVPAVLVSHCFVAGGEASESERPLSVGGADTVRWEPMKGFDYVALGHLHSPQWRGAEHLRYSGSLLKYSFSEVSQRKGVVLVDLEAGKPARISERPLQPRRDMRVLEGAFSDVLAQAETDEAPDDYLLIRLTDKHAILDTLAQLREHYPNVLHLEKPGLYEAGEARLSSREQLKRSEIDLFADFYQQVQGEPMTEEQQAALAKAVSDLHRAEAEQ